MLNVPTQNESAALLRFLRHVDGLVAGSTPADTAHTSTWGLVLKHGWVFTSEPDASLHMTPTQCFRNSRIVAARRRNHVYVEGYATSVIPGIHHAWVARHDGTIIDPTWSTGDAYIGVPFEPRWARAQMLETRNCQSILDNWLRGHALERNGIPPHAVHPDYVIRDPKPAAIPIELFTANIG